jgi:hypothetical protein
MLVLMPHGANSTEVTPYGTFVPYADSGHKSALHAMLLSGND